MVAAIFLSRDVLASVFGEDSLAEEAGSLAQRGRVVLLLGGAALFVAGWRFREMGRKAAVFILSLAAPLLGFEAFAGPFVGRDTTIFEVDQELGWRLRPGAKDVWLGADVEINAQGMRGGGPRGDASQKILFLGDSVVFGAFLERDVHTLTSSAEAFLAAQGLGVQCLNGGVGGWAPWQERLWYERQGGELGADVVLVNLVLNDVTEPLVLPRHGGIEEGFQLDRSREPGWLRGTSWATALRHWRRRARGEEEQAEAERAAALGVYQFLRTPALPDSREAWGLHLREVEALVTSISESGARPVVVSHPYTVQFELPELWWPQAEMAAWCSARDVPHLDIGKALAASSANPEEAYHDAVHPNREGAALIGREIATFLLKEGLAH